MRNKKCGTCYNLRYRLDKCIICKRLFEEMKDEVLNDEYLPMINNPCEEI